MWERAELREEKGREKEAGARKKTRKRFHLGDMGQRGFARVSRGNEDDEART